ncbi:MAG: ABC transporter ATP-binding protein [Clostridiaceae bacterium]|nr:ABC transporter ATP-binding protein [Clostridiaceae bacterium]
MSEVILSVKNLSVEYRVEEGIVKAVNDVSFDVKSGETLGLVGETGAGKTTIALSIMGLLPVPPAVVTQGEILFEGENILAANEKYLRTLRGNKISMIFQDPMSALNPSTYVGDQISEVIMLHNKVSKDKAREMAEECLEMVGIPKNRYAEYPHKFSGGMKQRVIIAIALACNPNLLIADEPTTALDVTIQAQILELMEQLKEKKGTSNILITHDLGVIAKMCDRVAVIYAGEIVEMGTLRQVFKNTAHPYTKGLFDALPGNSLSGKRLKPIKGSMPDPTSLPENCKFANRCFNKSDKCDQRIKLVDIGDGHLVRCVSPLCSEGVKSH